MSNKTRHELDQDMQRANEAKQILNSTVFDAALTFVESSALSLCRTAQTAEEAFTGTLRAQAAQSVKTILHAFLANGEAAAREIAEQARVRREEIEADEAHANYLSAAREARSPSHFTTASPEKT